MDASAFRAWIAEATRLVVEHADHLTHLDAAIGDADHGINLRRGFQAAVTMLDESEPATPGAVLATVGRALITKTGGASGPLYGTGFRQAAKSLGEDADVSAVQLGAALQAALAGIQQLGAASEGDKTMVDALGPAVSAYQAVIDTGGDLAEATRAAAERGADLAASAALAREVNDRSRSFGVALTACTVPAAGKPGFDLGEDEIELGVGIHGEPGRTRGKLGTAKQISAISLDAIHADMPLSGEVLVMVNGLGGTPLIELYVVFAAVADWLAGHGVTISRSLVGNYITSLEMAGCSITVCRLTPQLTELWDAPVETPALRWGR